MESLVADASRQVHRQKPIASTANDQRCDNARNLCVSGVHFVHDGKQLASCQLLERLYSARQYPVFDGLQLTKEADILAGHRYRGHVDADSYLRWLEYVYRLCVSYWLENTQWLPRRVPGVIVFDGRT